MPDAFDQRLACFKVSASEINYLPGLIPGVAKNDRLHTAERGDEFGAGARGENRVRRIQQAHGNRPTQGLESCHVSGNHGIEVSHHESVEHTTGNLRQGDDFFAGIQTSIVPVAGSPGGAK